MTKIKEPIFTWDEETGIASCIVEGNKYIAVGNASCHPDDADMKSEKTGCEIAYRRAVIDGLRTYRDCELKPALAALKQLYYSMNKSKRFNEKSYENIMLQRQIRQKEFDLSTVNDMINNKQESLRTLIREKDEFYKQIRKNRQKANNK